MAFFERMEPTDLGLCLFFTLVTDKNGISWEAGLFTIVAVFVRLKSVPFELAPRHAAGLE